MSHFNLEHEIGRINRARQVGTANEALVNSTAIQLRAVIAERTKTINPFELEAAEEDTAAEGFDENEVENKGYKLSVKEATSDQIAARYQLEIDGYNETKKSFFKLPKYSTHLLMSPAPDIEIPGYEKKKNMMYLYHVLPGPSEEKRNIKALTWENKFSKEEQAEIANTLMGKEVAQATTESILMTPVGVCDFTQDTKSFQTIWEVVGRIYHRKKRDFPYYSYSVMEEILLNGKEAWEKKHAALAAMTTGLAERIVGGETGEQLQEDYRILMNLADKRLLYNDDLFSKGKSERYAYPLPNAAIIFDHYRDLGRYSVRQVATACGPSGELGRQTGYSIKGVSTSTFEVSQSDVTRISSNAKDWDYTRGDCVQPGCGRTNVDVGPCKICKICEAKYDSGELSE